MPTKHKRKVTQKKSSAAPVKSVRRVRATPPVTTAAAKGLNPSISKYIGETEKNLGRALTRTERAEAVLFFDEGEALMGKRTTIKDAHDRYANLETAYRSLKRPTKRKKR